MVLGVFTTRESAEETIEIIRKLIRNEEGKILF